MYDSRTDKPRHPRFNGKEAKWARKLTTMASRREARMLIRAERYEDVAMRFQRTEGNLTW